MNRFPVWILLALLTLVVSEVKAQPPAVVRGVVVQQQIEAGSFHVYIPTKVAPKTNVLVICHGTIGKNETALKTARTFINRWLKFSEFTGVVLVAPAFDVANYASGETAPGGAAWGYRALDGRTTTSDEFVHAILDQLKTVDPKYDGKFYLYGHSAGAQFANHYLVVHPHRLNGVILSAPAIYAMPDPNTGWPNGLQARKRILQWGNITKEFEISHKLETVVEAAQLPIAVVIGTRDTKRMSNKPQQGGWTRLDRAQHYVNEMQKFAVANKVQPNIGLVAVPKIGHNSAGLTEAAGKALMLMGQNQQLRNEKEAAKKDEAKKDEAKKEEAKKEEAKKEEAKKEEAKKEEAKKEEAKKEKKEEAKKAHRVRP